MFEIQKLENSKNTRLGRNLNFCELLGLRFWLAFSLFFFTFAFSQNLSAQNNQNNNQQNPPTTLERALNDCREQHIRDQNDEDLLKCSQRANRIYGGTTPSPCSSQEEKATEAKQEFLDKCAGAGLTTAGNAESGFGMASSSVGRCVQRIEECSTNTAVESANFFEAIAPTVVGAAMGQNVANMPQMPITPALNPSCPTRTSKTLKEDKTAIERRLADAERDFDRASKDLVEARADADSAQRKALQAISDILTQFEEANLKAQSELAKGQEQQNNSLRQLRDQIRQSETTIAATNRLIETRLKAAQFAKRNSLAACREEERAALTVEQGKMVEKGRANVNSVSKVGMRKTVSKGRAAQVFRACMNKRSRAIEESNAQTQDEIKNLRTQISNAQKTLAEQWLAVAETEALFQESSRQIAEQRDILQRKFVREDQLARKDAEDAANRAAELERAGAENLRSLQAKIQQARFELQQLGGTQNPTEHKNTWHEAMAEHGKWQAAHDAWQACERRNAPDPDEFTPAPFEGDPEATI